MKKTSTPKRTTQRFWNARGLLVLRVALGLVFLLHGSQKLFGAFGGGGIEGTIKFFIAIGIPSYPWVPLAGIFAVAVAIIEFFGGIALIIGLLTRWASGLLAFIMLMSILLVHLKQGFFLPGGMEFVFVLFAGSLALLMTGPGRWAMSTKY